MAENIDTVDLLSPAEFFRNHYILQVKSTIAAYSPPMVVVGEAIQNAIDAICERGRRKRDTSASQ